MTPLHWPKCLVTEVGFGPSGVGPREFGLNDFGRSGNKASPEQWSINAVVLFIKKGGLSLITNYRGIHYVYNIIQLAKVLMRTLQKPCCKTPPVL